MKNVQRREHAGKKIEDLEARLHEAEETLRAIRNGEVDALVISGEEGEQVYTLKTAEHPYRILVEAISEGAATLDNEGTVLYCNGSFTKILKTTSEHVLGATLGEFVVPADRTRYETLLRQCRNKSARGEVRMIAGGDREVDVLLSLSPLTMEDVRGVSLVLTDLSEQKRQQHLIASEKLLRSILEQASEATIVCDRQGRIIHASHRVHQLCAGNPVLCDFDEILRLYRELESPDSPAEKLAFSFVLHNREIRGLEVLYFRPDGQIFDLLLSSGVILDSNGEILACVVTLVDITERKRVEAALYESEARLRAIFDGTFEFIGLLSPDGTVLEANRAALNWIGKAREDVIGRPFWETSWWTNTKEASPQVYAAIQRASQGEPVRHEVTLANPRGEAAVFDFSLHPIRNENGKVVLLVPEGREITDRVKAARELERRFRDSMILIETNRALVGALEFDRVTQAICEAARELTGADGVAFILREGERVHYVAENAMEPLWKGRIFPIDQCISGWVMQHGATVVIDDIYSDSRVPHGIYRPTFVRSILMTPVGLGSPVASIGVYWAEQHRANAYEVELLHSLSSAAGLALSGVRAYDDARRAWAQAKEANRLKDEFLATLSHELRNPLNSIVGYAEVLLRSQEVKRMPAVLHAAETIRRNAGTQAQLINDLLDLSRLQTGKFAVDRQPISLAAVIGDALESVRAQATAKQIELHMLLPDEQMIVDADPVRIQQIVWNLLSNAIKFTPSSGQVTVGLQRSNGEALLVVEDTGQGINPEFLPHVFEMFRQYDAGTTRPHGGMGIGLALVRQLVELHGGRVGAASEGIGKGARFTVTLPLLRVVNSMQPYRRALRPGNELSGARMLVVDDSPDSLEMLRLLLSYEGASVTTATSGDEGLKAAQSGEFHLIISDISMPEMDGYDFLSRLRTDFPKYTNVPAIALTGFGRDEDIERARLVGFTTHLTKPIDFSQLLRLARVTLRR